MKQTKKGFLAIILLVLVFFPVNTLFSQDMTGENTIIYVIYMYAEFIHTSMTTENESNFLYQMRYYGRNIEEGIEEYINSHQLIFNDENIPDVSKVYGYSREEGNRILEYVRVLVEDEYFRDIFYLAVAWNICDYKILYYNLLLSIANSRSDFERLNEYTWAKTAIESRANVLSISSPMRRFILSLFDTRTYTRLGL